MYSMGAEPSATRISWVAPHCPLVPLLLNGLGGHWSTLITRLSPEASEGGSNNSALGTCSYGGHADDGLVEVGAAGGAVEVGVAVGEDAAVGGDEPVAVAGGGGRGHKWRSCCH